MLRGIPSRAKGNPNRLHSARAAWQRELWSTDTSSDGGCALKEATDVAARPHGWPSSRRAVITETPDANEAIAS